MKSDLGTKVLLALILLGVWGNLLVRASLPAEAYDTQKVEVVRMPYSTKVEVDSSRYDPVWVKVAP